MRSEGERGRRRGGARTVQPSPNLAHNSSEGTGDSVYVKERVEGEEVTE